MVDPDSGNFVSGPGSIRGEHIKPRSVEVEEGPSNILNAVPGEVQSKINDVSSREFPGVVRLNSQERYTPTSTLTVRNGVVLDFNGAILEPAGDRDILEILPNGRVVDPIIDFSGKTFTSNVFTISTVVNGGNYLGPDKYVDGGVTRGNDDPSSTVFYYHAANGDTVSKSRSTHDTYNVGTVMECHAVDPESNVDGNIIRGAHHHHDIGLYTHNDSNSDGIVNGNRLEGYLQVDAGPTGSNGMLIDAGDRNTIFGHIWDPGNYSDAAVKFTSNAGILNHYVSLTIGATGSITNKSGSSTNGQFALADISNVGSDLRIGERSRYATESNQQTVIGTDAQSDGGFGTVVGQNASTGQAASAFGQGASAWSYSTAIGKGAKTTAGGFSVALGNNTTVNTSGIGRIGVDQLVFGGVQGTISDTDLNSQELTIEADETNNQFIIRYKDSSGTVRTATLEW